LLPPSAAPVALARVKNFSAAMLAVLFAGVLAAQPPAGMVPAGMPPAQAGAPQAGRGAPQQGNPQQGFPQQGFPQQSFPQQGFPQQGFPQQGFPQQGGLVALAAGAAAVQVIVHCEHVRAVSMMASLQAIFAPDQLRVVLGPESFSPKLESAQYADTATGITTLAGSTEVSHMVKDLILIGDAKTVVKARQIVETLDLHRQQVRLHIKIVDIDFDALKQFGIAYDFSSYSLRETSATSATTGIINMLALGQLAHVPISINATLLALETRDQSRTLAEPTISLLDGERAFILIGDKILYPKLTGYTQAQTPTYDEEEVRVGIYVQVSVEMSGHGDLILAAYPQVSTITGYLNVAGASYPQISTREEQTTVRLHENETLVIGGLISDQEVKSLSQIPFLGNIPFLGELFRNRNHTRSKKDLVIMITPEILPEGGAAAEIAAGGSGHEDGGHDRPSFMPAAAPVFPAVAPPAPLGLPPLPWPESNPYSKAKAELGWLLFYDKRLSSDGTVACATCHMPDASFADGRERPLGVGGTPGRRNSPSIVNAAYSPALLWDGGAASLEAEAMASITNPAEMNMDAAKVLKTISLPEYRTRFREVFGKIRGSFDQAAQAIATFERLVVSGNAPYDRYMAGDTTALDSTQQRGLAVFTKQCASCHAPPLFTNGSYVRAGFGRPGMDNGRQEITGLAADRDAFKVPTLRESARTAPYMHDGSVATLEEVIHLYMMGRPGADPRVNDIRFAGTDLSDLEEFLRSLNGEGWQRYGPPLAAAPFR
jgi:cytochrome c peroxidase